ncbi:10557_t:CDS:1 [Paraglomus brasilianum]|uniref:10557_t:CDS:1 n=1 Tax=Paraglomus brasilianum TaxID=144538 RepID=A0A9N9D2E8_9GLOM|nr:10557_t:CDS:1 [Paraglomus brasilianum]
MSRIDVSEPSNTSSTTEEITTNEHKLNQMERGFLTALVKLLLHDETEQACRVATLFSRLENNPLDPLYEGIGRIQTIVKYVCAESPTKERVRSDLEQLVTQHLSRNSDVAAGDSVPKPESDAGTSVKNITSDSRPQKKRRTVPVDKKQRGKQHDKQRDNRANTAPLLLEWRNNIPNSPFIYYQQPPSSNPVGQPVLPSNHMSHQFQNSPSLETTTETNINFTITFEEPESCELPTDELYEHQPSCVMNVSFP